MDVISGILICVVSILIILYAYFQYSFRYFQLRGIPCAKPSIPYGNIEGIGNKYHMVDIAKKIYDEFKPTGAKVCGVYIFTWPATVILDLDTIKNVFVRDFSNFVDRNLYYNEKDDPLSANLLNLDGSYKWKKLRTIMTPTFTSGKMKFMFPTIVMVAEQFRDHLRDEIQQNNAANNGCVLDMNELCARYTTDVIGTCAFGIECNSLNDPDVEFRRYGRKWRSNPKHGILFKALLFAFRNIARKLHIKLLSDDVAAFFTNVVRGSVDYRIKNNVSRNDFMELLIKLLKNTEIDAKNSITFNELKAQAFLFYSSGFAAPSTVLTFCLYELAVNPKIQAKARHAIETAYQKHGGENDNGGIDNQFTYEMTMDMPYIDQVLEETLRKYPIGTIITRRAKNDYPIHGTDVVIQGGTTVIIPVNAIHHDPEYYPDPERFDPDRFEREAKKNRDPMKWLAFGAGPRNCIGIRFAMMQARIALVALIKDFEFSISPQTTIPISLNKKSHLTIANEAYLKVKPVK